jgi:hypothetical protein
MKRLGLAALEGPIVPHVLITTQHTNMLINQLTGAVFEFPCRAPKFPLPGRKIPLPDGLPKRGQVLQGKRIFD